MPPADRFVPRFAAEPPQEGLPYGRFADRLAAEFLAACGRAVEGEASTQVGSPGEIAWHPDRTWNGITYVPASAVSEGGYELFGYVSFAPALEGSEPQRFAALADYTEQTAERNPDWKLDISDEVIGHWRGRGGARASMTLVWGRALTPGGQMATAELGGVTVDQCELTQERFALIAPDDYQSDLLEVALFDGRGRELARESLYEEDGEGQEEVQEGEEE
jgi:hypothetical protein